MSVGRIAPCLLLTAAALVIAARGEAAPGTTTPAAAPAARATVSPTVPAPLPVGAATTAPATPTPRRVRANADSAARPAPGTARVTYVSGITVYLDAGQRDGLSPGDTLSVVRAGKVVARLVATYLASHHAACDTLSGSAALQAGDVARFVPHVVASLPTTAAPTAAPLAGAPALPLAPAATLMPHSATAAVPNPPRARSSRVRGRLGARMLAIQSREAGTLVQPALDARLEAVNAGGLPIDLVADVRGRRSVRSGLTNNSTESSTRVYRLAASLHDAAAHMRLTMGRQASPMLASVSLFDGGLGEWGGKHWTVGAFGGTQPDPVQLTPSSDISQSGLYLETHQSPQASRRWNLAVGGVTSSARGQVNRDFAFIQGSYHDPVVSLSVAQEADILRGWRRDSTGSSFSLTSSFATLNVRPAEGLSLYGGYDGRRNVRLYRDRETPETLFDDRVREGGWLGTSVEMGRHARLGGDARTMGGGSDRVNTLSWSGELMRMSHINGRMRVRYSQSDAPMSRSRLLSFGAGVDPFDGGHLELTGGTRRTMERASMLDDKATWTSADIDVTMLRRLLFSFSWERTRGALEHVDQQYGGLSVRF